MDFDSFNTTASTRRKAWWPWNTSSWNCWYLLRLDVPLRRPRAPSRSRSDRTLPSFWARGLHGHDGRRRLPNSW